MTDEEFGREILTIFTESATDIRWLKNILEKLSDSNATEHASMLLCIQKMNGQTQKNKQAIAGAFLVEAIIITTLLHLLGVY